MQLKWSLGGLDIELSVGWGGRSVVLGFHKVNE